MGGSKPSLPAICYHSGMTDLLSQIRDGQTCPVALLIREGKVLTGHRHYTRDKWKVISVWTFPGGRCDSGESLEETLRREVYEETGIKDLNIVEFIGEAPGAKEGDRVPLFLCTTSEDVTLMEPEKFSEWRWVTKEDFVQNEEYGGFSAVRQLAVKFLDTAEL